MVKVMVIESENSVAPSAGADAERIRALVAKHCQSQYRLPISATMEAAILPALEQVLRQPERRLVLDAGCGTGASTAAIATQHPDAFVIGVDRSQARLRRAPAMPPNALLVRARLEEFWLLVQRAGIVFDKTFLLYPNPYPKHRQIKRRWYCHPIFPVLLATTCALELRTTEKWYANDFCLAIEQCRWECSCQLLPPTDADVLSTFERKYVARRQQRWKVCAQPR